MGSGARTVDIGYCTRRGRGGELGHSTISGDGQKGPCGLSLTDGFCAGWCSLRRGEERGGMEG